MRFEPFVAIISIACLLGSCGSSEPTSVCDCKSSIIDAARGQGEVYRKCLLQDFDAAFDFWEQTDPNRIFEDQEAVIQAYWMEKCKR